MELIFEVCEKDQTTSYWRKKRVEALLSGVLMIVGLVLIVKFFSLLSSFGPIEEMGWILAGFMLNFGLWLSISNSWMKLVEEQIRKLGFEFVGLDLRKGDEFFEIKFLGKNKFKLVKKGN